MTLEIKLLKQWLEAQIEWCQGLLTKSYDAHATGYIEGKIAAFKEVRKRFN